MSYGGFDLRIVGIQDGKNNLMTYTGYLYHALEYIMDAFKKAQYVHTLK